MCPVFFRTCGGGIVNLLRAARSCPVKSTLPIVFSRRRSHPIQQTAAAEQVVVSRPQEVSTDSEEILHDTVNRREPLELSGRLETPHLALSLTRRLVGDLGSIVRVLISDVDHGRHHGAARGGVGAQLVGDQSWRDTALYCAMLIQGAGVVGAIVGISGVVTRPTSCAVAWRNGAGARCWHGWFDGTDRIRRRRTSGTIPTRCAPRTGVRETLELTRRFSLHVEGCAAALQLRVRRTTVCRVPRPHGDQHASLGAPCGHPSTRVESKP